MTGILLAVLVEFKRLVALMAIKDEEPVPTYSTSLCVRIEVPELVHTLLVRSPPIVADCKNPASWDSLLLIPGG